MAAPKTTIWDLPPHSRAKHEILRRYLQAWTPILAHGGFPSFAYIDGFAGPGRYSKEEDGSPIIALKTALSLRTPITAKVAFLFVELDKKRAAVLQELVDELPKPANIHVKVAAGQEFEQAMAEFLGWYSSRGKRLPPTFAFIDPFGWKGVPFSVIRELAQHQGCEVLVTFMYEEVNRFLGHPDQPENFNRFFGTGDWAACLQARNERDRNRCLHDLYGRQLRAAGLKYVRSFEMRNDRDVTDYFLFYGTSNLLGLKKMKEAMWKVDEAGEFRFSDATNPNQGVFFEKKPGPELLTRAILERFSGKEATVGEIEEFVLVETAFRETHYKQQVLRPLELATPPKVTAVTPTAGRKPGTYADAGLRLRFAPPRT